MLHFVYGGNMLDIYKTRQESPLEKILYRKSFTSVNNIQNSINFRRKSEEQLKSIFNLEISSFKMNIYFYRKLAQFSSAEEWRNINRIFPLGFIQKQSKKKN